MFRKPSPPACPHLSQRKPQRMVDMIDVGLESPGWGTKEDKRWWGLMLSYDKNFRHLERCIQFDKALAENNMNDLNRLRDELYQSIDESYLLFSGAINAGHFDKRIGGATVQEYLSLVGSQIQDSKAMGVHPRKLMEAVFIKLSILADLSRHYKDSAETIHDEKSMLAQVEQLAWLWRYKDGFKRIDEGDLALDKEQGFHIGDFVRNVMHHSMSESIDTFKHALGTGFLSPSTHSVGQTPSYTHYLKENRVLPFFSLNGSLGFNTILCAIFHDYLPIGFGVQPMAVHTNYHGQQAYWTARHDYGHCFNRVVPMKKNNPAVFNKCKDIYFDLFREMESGAITEKTFRKELLVLFFIVYELGNNHTTFDSLNHAIIERTRDINEGIKYANSSIYVNQMLANRMANRYLNRKSVFKSQREKIDAKEKEKMKAGISFLTVLETIDFVKPLQELGYSFPDDIEKHPWQAAPALRHALLEMLDEFSCRHPGLFTVVKNNTQFPEVPQFDQEALVTRYHTYR